MRYLALATDFDGTLAHDGRVAAETIEALKELKKSGRKAILVTGRLVDSLNAEFPHLDLFDLVVAENGGVLYDPLTHETTPLAQAPPARFVETLRARNVSPLEAGAVIVSTWEPHETAVVDTIRDLGLEMQVIFNKGAVMTLPSGVNKASGLQAALERFELSAHNAAGVGDAENDHAFLQLCELSAAVANALPALKETADVVLEGDHGKGVTQLVRRMIDEDCATWPPVRRNREILLGTAAGKELFVDPYVSGITLIAGASGSGKSTLATGMIERIVEREYQVCIVDPEGDYESFDGVASLGDAGRAPTLDEVESLLRNPAQCVAVNLLGIPIDSRADFAAQLVPRLVSSRAKTGRPHWIVLDEAHQLLRKERGKNEIVPSEVFSMLAITTQPSLLPDNLRENVQMLVAVGDGAEEAVKEAAPQSTARVPRLERGKAALWFRNDSNKVTTFDVAPPKATTKRHRRKYAAGDLAPEKSFYFRGREGKLNLRAQNLNVFAQLAEGIDDETWLHHLRSGDVATWFREMIGDDDLARIAGDAQNAGADESRKTVVEEIHKRYTASA